METLYNAAVKLDLSTTQKDLQSAVQIASELLSTNTSHFNDLDDILSGEWTILEQLILLQLRILVDSDADEARAAVALAFKKISGRKPATINDRRTRIFNQYRAAYITTIRNKTTDRKIKIKKPSQAQKRKHDDKKGIVIEIDKAHYKATEELKDLTDAQVSAILNEQRGDGDDDEISIQTNSALKRYILNIQINNKNIHHDLNQYLVALNKKLNVILIKYLALHKCFKFSVSLSIVYEKLVDQKHTEPLGLISRYI